MNYAIKSKFDKGIQPNILEAVDLRRSVTIPKSGKRSLSDQATFEIIECLGSVYKHIELLTFFVKPLFINTFYVIHKYYSLLTTYLYSL